MRVVGTQVLKALPAGSWNQEQGQDLARALWYGVWAAQVLSQTPTPQRNKILEVFIFLKNKKEPKLMLELIFLKLLAYFVLHVRAIHSSEKSYFLKCVPYLCVNLFSM